MKDINVLNINNQQYRIVDPTKIPQPAKAGVAGQVLCLADDSSTVWRTINSPSNPEVSVIKVTRNNKFNLIKLDISEYPDTRVYQVTSVLLDTEQVLPFNTSQGITEVEYISVDDKIFIYIYVGNNTPKGISYNIYLMNGSNNIQTDTEYIEGAQDITYYYGYIANSVPVKSITEITADIVENSIMNDHIKMFTADDPFPQCTATDGSWIIALVPDNCSVLQASVIGNYRPFENIKDSDNNILSSAGTHTISLNNGEYKVYGKFLYLEDTISINIPELMSYTNSHLNSNIDAQLVEDTLYIK